MRSVDILLVEDSLKEIALIKNILAAEKIDVRLSLARNADEAIQFLRKQGPFELMPSPDLVLLDWYLPKFEDGERVLAAIKEDKSLRSLAVCMMSAYMQPEESMRVMGLGASCCIEKPLSLAKFIQIVHSVKDLFFTIVRNPISAC